MQYQSDYMLRLIEQVGALMRQALRLVNQGHSEESYQSADEALSVALDLQPGMAGRLSPQTLAALLEMRNLDPRVVELVAEAFDVQADILETAGEIVDAGVRREQAAGVRTLLDPSRAN